MGILNVTPDSFSDGEEFLNAQNALKRAKQMELEGADLIDIGGESTGPNSKFVPLKEELKRVIPILKLVKKHTKLPISIDTYKSEIAVEGLKNGASMVNDVTALRGDKNMAKVIAKFSCPVILMYSKNKTPRTTVQKKQYKNVIETIKDFFEERLKYAKKQGIKPNQIILDPGMGQFISSIPKYSFEIILRLQELTKLGFSICIGASRKSFLQDKMSTREEKGKIVNTFAYLAGASILRTHDIKNTVEFLKNLEK